MDYIPILVKRDRKQELWRMDISNLSLTELIKLKEDLLKMPYDKGIRILDAVIRREIGTITPSSDFNSVSYIRKYKKNKKEVKMRKAKTRRKYK